MNCCGLLKIVGAVRSSWKLSRAIDSCKGLPRAVKSCQGLSRTVKDCQWLSMAVNGCWGLLGAVGGCWKMSEADVLQNLFHGVLKQHPKTLYDVTRLILMAPMNFWQNYTPFWVCWSSVWLKLTILDPELLTNSVLLYLYPILGLQDQ